MRLFFSYKSNASTAGSECDDIFGGGRMGLNHVWAEWSEEVDTDLVSTAGVRNVSGSDWRSFEGCFRMG